MPTTESYHFVTPTDIDHFIQFYLDIRVDTEVTEGSQPSISLGPDSIPLMRRMDYVILCDVPKMALFNPEMDWKYNIDTSDGYKIEIEDAHGPSRRLLEPIINNAQAKLHLAESSVMTRFSHYKQANRFLKYSFRVGNEIKVPSRLDRTAQLYGVYLDAETGMTLPYWTDVQGDAGPFEPGSKLFYYADLDLSKIIDATATQLLYFEDQLVDVVCPPHPDYINSNKQQIGRNIVIAKNGQDESLIVRKIGPLKLHYSSEFEDYVTEISPDSFTRYDSEPGRELLLYWVVYPPETALYMGDRMFISWTSKRISNSGPDRWGPIRDVLDASGNVILLEALRGNVKDHHRFIVSNDIEANTLMDISSLLHYYERNVCNADLGDVTGGLPCSRLYFPCSYMTVLHEHPSESDTHDFGSDTFRVPFPYEISNDVRFGNRAIKSIMGARLMQMLSTYLFDAATEKEMAYFPFIADEAHKLTRRIIDSLAGFLVQDNDQGHDARDQLLKQFAVHYGRTTFFENAQNVDDVVEGRVWDVLLNCPELFILFLVTLKTTVSNRTKDRVEGIDLVTVPVVLRVHDPPKSSTIDGGWEHVAFLQKRSGVLRLWGKIDGVVGAGIEYSSQGSLRGQSIDYVDVGNNVGFAIDSIGRLHAWGKYPYQFDGAYGPVPRNITKDGSLQGLAIMAVNTGDTHTLVLDVRGEVHSIGCWDTIWNWGQLGNETVAEPAVHPVYVSNFGSLVGRVIRNIFACGATSFAIESEAVGGTLHAWGFNGNANYGDGTVFSSDVPLQIQPKGSLAGKIVNQLSGLGMAYDYTSCILALDSDGQVHAIGIDNAVGQLGNGTFDNNNSLEPLLVSGNGSLAGTRCVKIASEWEVCVALDASGFVHAWGRFSGNGTFEPVPVPINVMAYGSLQNKEVVDIGVAASPAVYAIDVGEHLHAWGIGTSGLLGGEGGDYMEPRMMV